MKKDIEWLVKMINEELDMLRQRIESGEATPNQKTFDEGRGWALSHVLRMMYYPDKLKELSKELPVIPEHVAEHLEFAKSDVPLMRILEIASTRDELPKWRREYNWISENDETFAKAWLDGYTVEEVPLYHALIKGHELLTREYAFKYWSYDTFDDVVFTNELPFQKGRYVTEMIKEAWDKLGINDSNADFVKVDE